MSLGCISQSAVDVASTSESAYQAAERMHQRTVGALVVIDNTNIPIGIVTDRDLMIRVIAAGRDPYTTSVREVMTPAPRTITSAGTVSEALEVMRRGAFRRLPVVNASGHLAGIVTLDDVVSQVSTDMAKIAELLQRESPAAAGRV